MCHAVVAGIARTSQHGHLPQQRFLRGPEPQGNERLDQGNRDIEVVQPAELVTGMLDVLDLATLRDP
jgi:hypothetical protein